MITLAPLHNARMRNIWSLRLTTFAVWFLAAGSAAYWGLQISARGASSSQLAQADTAGYSSAVPDPDVLAVAHGLGAVGDGAALAPPAAGASGVDWNPSRFALSGIVAQGSEKDGLVMLGVDGKPAQILQVGATVEPNVVVQALSRQSVTLANISKPDAPVLLTLKLGEPAASAQRKGAATQVDAGVMYAPSAPLAPVPVQPQVPAQAGLAQTQTQAVASPEAGSPTLQPTPHSYPDPDPKAQAEALRQDRQERLARLSERLAERRNTAGTSNAAAAPSKPAAPAPRRSVLSDDSLYFSD